MKNHNKNNLEKVIVILGPTASGKSNWGVRLAKKHNGEIISADSRQVYKKMDIGTAKVAGSWEWQTSWKGWRHMFLSEGIVHYLVDIIDPGKKFTVAEFKDKATKYIKNSHKNQHVPFVVGGTGLYISSLVDNLSIPRIAPNNTLRKSLEEKTHEQLLQLLENLDVAAVKTIDKKNKRRIIRALEVCILTGEPFSAQKKKGKPVFDFLQIGISVPRETLYHRINTRIDGMVEQGLVDEIKDLLRQKYSWQLPSMSGIGYRQFADYFSGKKTLATSVEELKRDTRRFARRQHTWFKRDKRIVWCETFEEAEKKVQAFLAL